MKFYVKMFASLKRTLTFVFCMLLVNNTNLKYPLTRSIFRETLVIHLIL